MFCRNHAICKRFLTQSLSPHTHTHTLAHAHAHTHKHMDTFKHALTLTLFSSKLSLSQQTLFHSHLPTFILSHTLSHALSQSHSFHFIRFIHSLSISASLPFYTLSPLSLSLSLSLYHSCYLSLATVLPSHCLPPLSHSICLPSLTLCASLPFLTHSLSPFSPSHTPICPSSTLPSFIFFRFLPLRHISSFLSTLD